jgi:hypothetical protein
MAIIVIVILPQKMLYYLFVDSRIRSILPWNFVGNWTRHFIFLGGQNGDDGIDIDGKTSI